MSLFSIPYESDRASLDRIKLHYTGPPVGWAGRWPHRSSDIELRIDGDEEAPSKQFVELAEIVLPKLEEVESASDAYLRAFVGDSEGFYTGSWKLQSLRMRQDPGSERVTSGEFEVTLCIQPDDYGEWSVRFLRDTYPSRKLRPYLFSRRQW